MSVLRADYFDGKRALRHEVSVMFSGGRLKLVGRDVSAEFNARKVRVAPRIANTPRWIYLPGGGACAIADNDAVDRFARERPFARLLHRLESRPAFAAVAVALVVSALWLLIERGVPQAAEYIAGQIPRGAETVLGEQTLSGLEQHWLQPSKLPTGRQAALRAKFLRMAQAGGETAPPRLEFRASPVIGPNAFALPAGIIVATDELVRLARNDEQVLAVLAHELGHVRYRHTMRQLLQGSATALIIAGVTGDIASTTSLAASAPVVLLQTKYSRDHEREADRFAIDLLQRTGIGPRHFAAILKRFEAKKGKRGGLPTFLSSHPPSAEREALALASATASAQDNDNEEGSDEDSAEAKPKRLPLAIVDPEQRQIAVLLERRDYEELERVLGGHQLAFEQDSKSVRRLEDAFRTFRKIPRSSEGALNAWVHRSPSSYVALVARGGFYLSQGLEARGTDFIQDTPEEDLRAMRAYFEQSSADLERSLGLSQKPYLSRRYLMTIGLYSRGRDSRKALYQEAVKLAPASVEPRLAHMTSLEPRWGGSYTEMQAFLAKSRAALDPEDANRLAARIPAYRGRESNRAKDFRKALEYFDEAIALDDDADVLCQRSHALSQLGRHKDAFGDVGRALSKARDDRYCMRMATYLANRVDDAAEVIRVLSLVIEVDPSSGSAYSWRGWSYHRLGKPELAFPDYLAAAKLDNAWAQLQVGKLYWSGTGVKQDREAALLWLQKAAEQGNTDAQTSLDQARKELERKPN
jgi:Zn-dependent protease with chaperone function/tetratricopeptide (TPR) repeat protein